MNVVRRLLAVLAAVAMVVVALQVRDRIESRGDGPEVVSPVPDGPLRIVCIEELAAACEDIEDATVVVEPAGQTLDRLSTLPGPSDTDAWLTLAPWPAMVEDARSRGGLAPLVGDPTGPVASSSLVVAGWRPRLGALSQHCGGELTWNCLGDAAGRPWQEVGGELGWGRVKPLVADPTTSAVGLLSLAQGTAEVVGTTDFTLAELNGDAYRDWLRRLADAAVDLRPGSELTDLIPFGPAEFDVAGTTAAMAARLSTLAGDRAGGMDAAATTPHLPANVVIAPIGPRGSDAVEALGDVGSRLQQLGWDAPAPSDVALPSPGALEALRSTWRRMS